VEPSRLAAIAFFSELDPDDLARIAERASEAAVAEGDVLASQGDFGHGIYAIEAGTADVAVDGAVVRTLGPGDVFGEIAVLASGRRTATVVATSPMQLITLFKRDVWALERDCPDVAERRRALIVEHQSDAAAQ